MSHIPAIPSWKMVPTWGNYTSIQMDSTANDSFFLIKAHFSLKNDERKTFRSISCMMGRNPSWQPISEARRRSVSKVWGAAVSLLARLPQARQAGSSAMSWPGSKEFHRGFSMEKLPRGLLGATTKNHQKPQMTLQQWMALGWHVQDQRADRNKNDALNRKMRLVSLPKPRDLRLCLLHTKEWKKGYRRGKEISEREKKNKQK